MFEALIAICIGLGLAASCGFRVFVPMLVAAVAAKAGFLSLSAGFEWLATWPAVVALGVATAVELGAYYIPWLDNFLDTVATPAAVIAGIITSAAYITDVDPMLRWSVAIIGGGGLAGIIKAGTVGVRATSTLLTGGAANPVVATAEWVFSLFLSLLSIVLPIFATAVAIGLLVLLGRFAWRLAAKLFVAEGKSRPTD